MNKKTGEFGFLIGNDVECFSVFDHYWEFYMIGDDFVFYGDGGWRIEQFDGDKNRAMFY